MQLHSHTLLPVLASIVVRLKILLLELGGAPSLVFIAIRRSIATTFIMLTSEPIHDGRVLGVTNYQKPYVRNVEHYSPGSGPTPGLTAPRGVPGVGPTPGFTPLTADPGYQLTVSPG